MPCVQLVLPASEYATSLQHLLEREHGFEVCRCDTPFCCESSIIVADRKALENCPALLEDPEHLVIITNNDAQFLDVLWNRGVRSVVFDTDQPTTALLAVLSVPLRKITLPRAC